MQCGPYYWVFAMLSHSAPGHQLPMIFYKIRAARTQSTRRSWQRRARLSLAQIPTLTDADRHEIMVVWSHPASHRINSPAMYKLTGRPPLHDADIDAATLYRARFDATGNTIPHKSADAKKPGLARPFAYCTTAANDSIFSCIAPAARPNSQSKSPDSASPDTAPASAATVALHLRPRNAPLSFQSVVCGSGSRPPAMYGTRSGPARPAMPSPHLTPPAPERPQAPPAKSFSLKPLVIGCLDLATAPRRPIPKHTTPRARARLTPHYPAPPSGTHRR